MTLSLPGVVTERSTAAIVTDGDATAKVEQVWWRGRGWHRGWRGGGWGWRHRGWAWHRGYGWRGRGCATGTLIVAAVGNTARRSPKARSANKALRVTFGATTPRSSLKFGHLCRQRTSSVTNVVSHVSLDKVIRG
jgi:hypothetical protein